MSKSTLKFIGWAALVALAILVVIFWIRPAKRSDPARSAATTPTPSSPAPNPAPADTHNPTDYRAACEAARSLRQPLERSREFGRLFHHWLERDFPGALAYFRQLPTGSERTEALGLLLGIVSARDIDQALALARELISTRDEANFYSSIFDQLAHRDVPGAVQRLAQVPAGFSRDNALRAVADVWAQSDPAATLAWAQKLPEGDRTPALETTLLNLAEKDPLHAIETATAALTGTARDHVFTVALQKLLETDPSGASTVVSLLPTGEVQTHAALDVAAALVAQNPANALTWVKTIADLDAQRIVRNRALELWTDRDPGAAAGYVAQLPPGLDQQTAIVRVATRYAAADTPQAITWANTFAADSGGDLARGAIASAWAQRDPAAATRWAAQLDAAGAPPTTLAGALSYWLAKDATGAAQFVTTLTGPTLEHAAVPLAASVAQTDPTAALAWAQSLSSPEASAAALSAAYSRWLGNSPASARAWLAASSLPAETKAMLARGGKG